VVFKQCYSDYGGGVGQGVPGTLVGDDEEEERVAVVSPVASTGKTNGPDNKTGHENRQTSRQTNRQRDR
jgi:hypothetical protein